jgi:TRAP transporter 4TM/12TM fusion protein
VEAGARRAPAKAADRQVTEVIAKFRTLDGPARTVERVLLLALTVVGGLWATQVHHHLPFAFFNEQYLGLFLALGLAPVFVCTRASSRAPQTSVPAYDWLLAAAALTVGGYVAVMYPTIAYTLGIISWDKLALAVVAIIVVLEAVRRIAGWALMWIAVVCLLYANLAWLFPGLLNARGSSWSRIAVYLYLDTNGILGVPLAVTATIVVAYIFFGQALYAVGGDKFLTDVAMIAMGRYRGGAAKMSVLSSSLYGTVSGSAVANVVVDGAITIPMMKRSGYPPHLAAAIEAVSSNGGQIMPPVMGAAAFLMAEYLSIPYGEVALAAAIPAALYYLALLAQVDLEAAKLGLAGVPRHEVPRLAPVMRRGWVFLVPLGVLVWALIVANWEAGKAGMLAVAVTFAVGALQKATRPDRRGVLDALESTGRTMLDLVAITTLAGIVIGSFQLSGLTSKLPLLLTSAAAGNLFVLLVLTAVVSILLGMSLPTTVVYVTLAVLVGPALAQMGVEPLAAHLFLFYFGMLSLITPPDCLATYAAAAIAKADFWRTGWTGMRLGIVAYIVPFVFVFHPALIGKGAWLEITGSVLTAAAGVILLSIGCAGFFTRPLGWPRRAWTFVAAAFFIMPPLAVLPTVAADAIGLVLGAAFIVSEVSASRPVARARPVEKPS